MTSCTKNKKQVSLLSPGISLDLANYRKKQVSNVVYTLSFDIPIEKDKAIKSNLDLSLQISDLKHPLYLDFNADSKNLKQVHVNGKVIPVKHQQEHLIIDSEFLKLGANKINVLLLGTTKF